MVNYNLILELLDEGMKITDIAKAAECSRGTVYKVRQLSALYGVPKNKGLKETRKALKIYAPRNDLIYDNTFMDFLFGLPDKNIRRLYELYCSVSAETGVKVYSYVYFRHVLAAYSCKKDEIRFTAVFRLRVVKTDDGTIWILLRSEDSHYFVCDALPLMNNSPRAFFKILIKLFQRFGCLPDKLSIDGRIKKEFLSACKQYCALNKIELNKTNSTDFFADVLKKFPDIDLDQINMARLAKGSAFSVYEAYLFSKRFLRNVPDVYQEYIERRSVKVQIDFHVSINKTRYSVPFEYRHSNLTAVIRDSVIEIFNDNNNKLVCSHKKSTTNYVTNPEHLPKDEEIPWSEVSTYKIRYKAEQIGRNTLRLVNRLLKSALYEVYAYNICLFIINQNNRCNVESICAEINKKKSITHSIVRMAFNYN